MSTLTLRSPGDMAEQWRRAERDLTRPARPGSDAPAAAAAVLEARDLIEQTPVEELDALRRHYASEEDVIRRSRGKGVREGTIAMTLGYYLCRPLTGAPIPF